VLLRSPSVCMIWESIGLDLRDMIWESIGLDLRDGAIWQILRKRTFTASGNSEREQ
jgi:hypothetical protein